MKCLIVSFLCILFLSPSVIFSDETELLSQVEQLSQQKKYANALVLLDNGLQELGETESLLAAKFQALLDLGRPKEALPVAIRRVEKAERKSPWHCIAVMEICLKLHDLDGAFAWLNARRGAGLSRLQRAGRGGIRRLEKGSPLRAHCPGHPGADRHRATGQGFLQSHCFPGKNSAWPGRKARSCSSISGPPGARPAAKASST